MNLIGEYVKNKQTGVIGVIEYSSFGCSIHMAVEHEGKIALGKSLGMSHKELFEKWILLESIPDGYVNGKHRVPVTLEQKERWDNQ